MFYVIGLGLSDVKDITVKGLEIVKNCEKVYLENYTSLLTVGKDELEKFYGRSLEIADRESVEQKSDEILNGAEACDVALLVVGDPFGATTHTDIILRAKEKNIPYRVIHNASIMNAVGCCGLQLYSFGETVSIPFWTDSWKPESFYDKIIGNRSRGLHTLCLLDIKVKEPTLESLMKKRKEYMPPRFMTVNEAATQLLLILQERAQNNKSEGSTNIGLGDFSLEDVVAPCAVDDDQLESLMTPILETNKPFDDELMWKVANYYYYSSPPAAGGRGLLWTTEWSYCYVIPSRRQMEGMRTVFKFMSFIGVAEGSLKESTRCIGLARVGSDTQKVTWCSLKEMTEAELGPPLHSLVVPGKLQVLEEQYLSQFADN